MNDNRFHFGFLFSIFVLVFVFVFNFFKIKKNFFFHFHYLFFKMKAKIVGALWASIDRTLSDFFFSVLKKIKNNLVLSGLSNIWIFFKKSYNDWKIINHMLNTKRRNYLYLFVIVTFWYLFSVFANVFFKKVMYFLFQYFTYEYKDLGHYISFIALAYFLQPISLRVYYIVCLDPIL